MTALRTEDLQTLLVEREGPCVSLYLPTHRTGREMQQDPIRLKNLLRQAEGELASVAIRSTDAAGLLKPARDLLAEPSFWEHASDGLAVFLAPGFVRTYRLPASFQEKCVVSGAFHLKSLLPLLSGDGQFYVLALSQKHVRLLQGSRFSVGELEPDGMPGSLKEALWVDDPERVLQYHSGTPSGGGRRDAVYHGQGGAPDVEKSNLLRYFRRVDEALVEFLEGQSAPLVLAGVDHYFPIYREASRYPNLVDGGVKGSPDDLSAAELHDRAWALVEPIFHAEQDKASGRYAEHAGKGKTSETLADIVPAAHHGRVETLFVALGEQRWGAFIPDGTGSVILHDAYEQGDRDLLDVAAAATLKAGGRVYALPRDQIPSSDSALAAIYRY